MDALLTPELRALAVERGMRRTAEGSAPAPAHQMAADIIVDRDEMPVGAGPRGDLADFRRQFRRHPFVGVDFDNPPAATEVDAGVAARTLALPGALDDPVGVAEGDRARAVGAAVE